MPDTPFWTQDSLEDIVSARSKIMGAGVWAAARPDDRPVISFAGGLPDVPSLPDEELLRATRAVLDKERREALQYGGTFGPQPLRQAIAERSSGIEGIPLTAEHVTVTSGAAHGIGIASEVLIDPGDTVLVESPTFPGSLRTFVSFGAQVEAVAMDDEGLRVDLAEEALAGCAIRSARGILNGTSNYILTQMESGMTYAEALAQAQALGYAETDPTADVEGWDAAGKVLILAKALFGSSLTMHDLDVCGITGISAEDIGQARQSSRRYKLIAEATPVGGSVSPQLLPLSDPLASVGGSANAITLDTDLLGEITIIGAGAGKLETGYALLADLMAIQRGT